MLKITILDPGLKELGSHHPAMIDSLMNSTSYQQGRLSIDVFCHQQVDEQFLENKKNDANIKIVKHFNTAFYQYFYSPYTQQELNNYVKKLSLEYLAALNNYKQSDTEPCLFLYHTLGQEHALALASAISLFNKTGSQQKKHFAFLMYDPVQYDDNNELNYQRYLAYKVAFNALAKQNNVQFFAGEYELSQSYLDILNRKDICIDNTTKNESRESTLAIHPCALLGQNRMEGDELTKNDFSVIFDKSKLNIMLFTGDAKITKGFLGLPLILQSLLDKPELNNTHFFLQYTLSNDSAQLAHVDERLKLIKESYSHRVTLVNHFVSHEELHYYFASCQGIILNYSPKPYKNQSSGILWLASLHNMDLALLTDTWLNREAQRLDCTYQYCKNINEIAKFTMKLQGKFDNLGDKAKALPNHYKQSLEQDIGLWFEEQNNNN